ncbi:MAG: glycosyltransferase [Lachnospiraceae bacterium]|nr:glycosyltransferase [Lachnospiraceae bacterium]
MKISVAMASYNGEKYIEEQLDSILSQTMPVDEIIICDDKSKDNTVKVVEEFISKKGVSDIINISVNEENLGYASNFISAVKKTTGDLIFFCDQDDIWTDSRVEEMVHIMEENKKIMTLGSEFSSFVSSPDAPSVPKWESKKYKNNKALEKVKFKPENIFIGAQGCTMCIRRSFFERIERYWYPGLAHDEFVWKFALCMEGLYMYHSYTLNRRLHSDNVSLRKMRDLEKRVGFLEDLLKSHETTLKFAKDINLNRKKIKLFERNIKATKLRIELLKDKKYFNTVKLVLFYFNCYHKSRSIPVELKMAVKG